MLFRYHTPISNSAWTFFEQWYTQQCFSSIVNIKHWVFPQPPQQSALLSISTSEHENRTIGTPIFVWASVWSISKETDEIELVVSNRQSNVLPTKPCGRLISVTLKVDLYSKTCTGTVMQSERSTKQYKVMCQSLLSLHNILSSIIFNNHLIRSENTHNLSWIDLIQFAWWRYWLHQW